MSDDTKVPNLTVVPINTSSGEGNDVPSGFMGLKNEQINHKVEFFDDNIIDIIERDDELYFKLQDVVTAIGYSTVDNALKLISNDYRIKLKYHSLTKNKIMDTWYISELGLYQFATKAKTPKVEPFQKWVYRVIKEIRQTGGYNLQQAPSNDLAASITAIIQAIQSEAQVTRALIEAKYNTIDNLVNKNMELTQVIISNQQYQQKQELVEAYTDQVAAVNKQAFATNGTYMTMREFATSIGKTCTNSMLAGNILIKSNFQCRYLHGCRAFKIEDLKLFFDWHPSMFT